MGLLGGIGFAAALANYNSAKKAYDAAVEKEQGLLAVVQANIKNRDQAWAAVSDGATNPNKPLDGVTATTVLCIGNLADVRPFNRMQASVILENTTDKTFIIRSAAADCRLNGVMVNTTTSQRRNLNAYLYPQKQLIVPLAGSKIILDSKVKQAVKEAICKACGRTLITSCWQVDVKDIESADIVFEYQTQSGADSVKRARYTDVAGVVRYMGEAFYPSEI